MSFSRHPWLRFAGWLLLLALMLFLTLNRHSRADRFNYHSEIWGDKAGYYIYLPLAFEYGFDATHIQDTALYEKVGRGFSVPPGSSIAKTKYPYGVALAELPFYLLANVLVKETDNQPPGFSVLHNRMVSVAAAVYLILGLFFLSRFLSRYFNRRIICAVLGTLLLSTNLYYYGVFETGMSHVYSFALFAVFLWFLHRSNYLSRGHLSDFFVFGLLCGWIVVLRPVNLLFLPVFFFLDLRDMDDWKARWKRLFRPLPLALILLGAFLLVFPQMLYWKYAYGSYLAYSYGDESFHWMRPQWINMLFSPNNGLFLYLPVYLLILVFAVWMYRQKLPNARLLLFGFLLLTYVFSCWWEWGYGCGFGIRCYVEYLPLFAIVLGYFFEWLKLRRRQIRVMAYTFLLVCSLYSFKMMYSYDGCFPGHKNWDWRGYVSWLTSSTR